MALRLLANNALRRRALNPTLCLASVLQSPQRAFSNIPTTPRQGAHRTTNNFAVTVFGGTGFAGKHVIGLLGQIGCNVIIPYRGDGYYQRELKLAGDLGQIVNYPCPLADYDKVVKSMYRSSVCVNMLGDWKETTHYTFHDSHVKTSYRIAKAAKEAGVQRFVHVSALGASYDSPSAFLRAKAESEDVVRSFFPDAVILRPAVLHGENDRFLDWQAEMGHWWRVIPVIDGGQSKVQPLFVHDFANAVLNSITYDKAAGNTYELAGPKAYTRHELNKYIIDYCNLPKFTFIPSIPLPVARVIGKLVNKLPWQRWRYITEDIAVRYSMDNVIQPNLNVKTLKDLGITPHDLEASSYYALLVIRAEYTEMHSMDPMSETGRNL